MSSDPDDQPQHTEQFSRWMRLRNYVWPSYDVYAQRDMLDEYLLDTFRIGPGRYAHEPLEPAASHQWVEWGPDDGSPIDAPFEVLMLDQTVCLARWDPPRELSLWYEHELTWRQCPVCNVPTHWRPFRPP
jgi:hypothetical protein